VEGNIVFGPVVSRRLGISLGINNVPYKTCSYSCIYCQLGRTINLTVERKPYSDPDRLVKAVSEALERSGKVDFVTFVPDGEPTLDSNIGASIRLLKLELWVDIAVLTNASLLWRDDVRLDLSNADLISIKVDAAREATWRRINRPHPSLVFERVIDGIRKFTREYTGAIITETMLVEGVNDNPEELKMIADIIASISPRRAYIMIPTRPPAEEWVRGAGEQALTILHEELKSRGVYASLLTSDEPPPPVEPSDPVNYVLATSLVHPLRIDYVEDIAKRAGRDPEEVISEVLKRGAKIVEYRGLKFIVRRPIPRRTS
jgi:wyosine [tRNA(Phe)-imidazoG37] synthetase (radical SAM superfamily)